MTTKKGSNTDIEGSATAHVDDQVAAGGLADDQAIFEEQVEALYESFGHSDDQNESDYELATALMQLILERQRLQRGVANDERLWPDVDEQTIKALTAWDTDDPDFSTIQKVFNRLAVGRGESAVTLLKRAICDKKSAVSKVQRRRAKTPRTINPIDQWIDDILKKRPDITISDLREKLEGSSPNDVIRSIEDGEIIPQDTKLKPIQVSGLATRLSRRRKKSK